MAERDEFTVEWQKAKLKAFPPPAAPKAPWKGKGRGKKRKAGDDKKEKTLEIPDGNLTQEEVKHLCPPGGHIWRGNDPGSWNGHVAPFKRCMFSWHLYGHRESALLCLRDMWAKHLTRQVVPLEECPVLGLFELGDASLPPAKKKR